jgi:hypothetical protein
MAFSKDFPRWKATRHLALAAEEEEGLGREASV